MTVTSIYLIEDHLRNTPLMSRMLIRPVRYKDVGIFLFVDQVCIEICLQTTTKETTVMYHLPLGTGSYQKHRFVTSCSMCHYKVTTTIKAWCVSSAHFLTEKSIVLPHWKDYIA